MMHQINLAMIQKRIIPAGNDPRIHLLVFHQTPGEMSVFHISMDLDIGIDLVMTNPNSNFGLAVNVTLMEKTADIGSNMTPPALVEHQLCKRFIHPPNVATF